MFRKSIRKSTSKKIFRGTAGAHPRNFVNFSAMRGGIRL